MRHGKTEWNKLRRYQGSTDIPLNDEGINQVRNACIQYKDVNIDICFCSPLLRARQTAELFLEGRNIPVIYDDRLKEMSFGEYEGTFKTDDPKSMMTILFDKPENFIPGEGGERLEDVLDRTESFIEEYIFPNKNKDILIVGHGAMNSALVCNLQNIPIKNYWQSFIKNCELRKIDY